MVFEGKNNSLNLSLLGRIVLKSEVLFPLQCWKYHSLMLISGNQKVKFNHLVSIHQTVFICLNRITVMESFGGRLVVLTMAFTLNYCVLMLSGMDLIPLYVPYY